MRPPIECRGAPRDLGFDQGAACRAELAAAYARSGPAQRLRWRLGRREPAAARLLRDVARHFPRHAEALQGLARGAGVPRAWLEELLTRHAADPGDPGEAIGVAGSTGTGSALLGRARPGSWMLRRTRPEGGFACLELAPAWHCGAFAALSEVGIAGVAVPRPGADGGGRCAAPAHLLLQDALHRAESLAGTLEWCLRRPAGGRVTLLFGDAEGRMAGVVVAGDQRRVLRPDGGLLVEAAGRESELDKALRQVFPLEPRSLARGLGPASVLLDPAGRRLALASAQGPLDWVALG